MKTYKMKLYGKEHTVRLSIASYVNNGNLAVALEVKRGLSFWDDAGMLTVNIGPQQEPNLAMIDTNNLGNEIIEFLKENDLARSTGWAEYCGFCRYPQVMFSPDALKQADPQGYQEHISQWETRASGGKQDSEVVNTLDEEDEEDEIVRLFSSKNYHE